MDLRAWLASGKRPQDTSLTAGTPTKQAKVDATDVMPMFSKSKARELLAMEEFNDQPLEVRKGQIYCLACKAAVGCEARLLRQHCFQSQKVAARVEFQQKGEEQQLKLRHYKKSLKLAREKEKGAILLRAIELNREKLVKEAEGAVAMRKNLDDATIARREWWWSMRREEGLSQWSLLARIAVLHQPSSAVIERFFSVYKGMTSAQQFAEDEDTSLLRALTRYNKGKVGL